MADLFVTTTNGLSVDRRLRQGGGVTPEVKPKPTIPIAPKATASGEGISVEHPAGAVAGQPIATPLHGPATVDPNKEPVNDAPKTEPAKTEPTKVEPEKDAPKTEYIIKKDQDKDGVSGIITREYEVVGTDGETSAIVPHKKHDKKSPNIAFEAALKLTEKGGPNEFVQTQTKAKGFHKNSKSHGYDTSSDLINPNDKLTLSDEIKLKDGTILRRKGFTPPVVETVEAEAPKQSVAAAATKEKPYRAPDARRRDFLHDGVVQDGVTPKGEAIFRPVKAGKIDREHSLTVAQAKAREASIKSEGTQHKVAPKETYATLATSQYINESTGKPIDVNAEDGKDYAAAIQKAIFEAKQNKGVVQASGTESAAPAEGQDLFLPKSVSSFGHKFTLKADYDVMNAYQAQNQQKWTVWDWIMGRTK